MTDGKRRAILIGGALAAVAIIVAGVFVLWPSSSDGETAKQTPAARATTPPKKPASLVIAPFLKALSAGKVDEAAALTDNPAAARDAISRLYKGVPVGSLKYEGMPSTDANPTTVPVTATLKVSSPIAWNLSMPVSKVGDDKWVVKWAPTILHPKLKDGQTIAVLGETGETGQPAVLDEAGQPIAMWEGSTAKPKDPKISPVLMDALVSGGSSGGGSNSSKQYVAIIDSAGKDVELLFGEKPAASTTQAVKSTVNPKVAIAAQNAVDTSSQPTIIVAIKPSTGGILAVAQNSGVSGRDAFSGLRAPGSSFKIVTAAAAIQQQNLNTESMVECPGSKTISGRRLNNAGFELGTTKLRTAFAKSCNTTFGEIASKLPPNGLRAAADQFGLNADFDIPGVPTEMGKVEDTSSAVQRVEDSIGQGKVTASPLGMAIVAATVAGGKAIKPRLRMDAETTAITGYRPPPAEVLGQIRTMMRDVVTSGTATALSKFKNVAGKTGTAETESQGDNAHGWFVGYRGDVAFAVLVVDGRTSAQAVAVTSNFLSGF